MFKALGWVLSKKIIIKYFVGNIYTTSITWPLIKAQISQICQKCCWEMLKSVSAVVLECFSWISSPRAASLYASNEPSTFLLSRAPASLSWYVSSKVLAFFQQFWLFVSLDIFVNLRLKETCSSQLCLASLSTNQSEFRCQLMKLFDCSCSYDIENPHELTFLLQENNAAGNALRWITHYTRKNEAF